MNILIVQQLAWGLRIGHEVARVLHARGHNLAALVHGQEVNEFVNSQSEVPYSHVYFADPLYDEGDERVSEDQIREMEERYDLPSIWRVIYSDRILVFSFLDSRHFVARKPVSGDYILSVCWRTHCLIKEMLDRVKPDYVLAPNIGSLANYLLYLECQHLKIPFLSVGFSRFGNHFYIADDQYQCSGGIRARFEALRACPEISPRYEEAGRIYSGIRRDDPVVRPTYARNTLRGGWSVEKLLREGTELALFPARVARGLYRRRQVLAIRNIWMPANSRWNHLRNLYVNLRERFIPTDNQGECFRSVDEIAFRYIYFPLHVEPELSLLVFAPDYANQVELCRRVALGLPRGVRLLVKEHPGMVQSRPRHFYDDLRGLFNVELIHSTVPSHEIFTSERCRGVIVVSSTVGFEAAINRIPLVLLARAQYEVLPSVYRATSLDDAIERLREFCTGMRPVETTDVDRVHLAYLCALLENSFSFDYLERWSKGAGEINVDALIEAVHQRLQDIGALGCAGAVHGTTRH